MSTSYPPRAASTPASLNSTFQLPISPDLTNLNTSPSPARRQPDATFNWTCVNINFELRYVEVLTVNLSTVNCEL